MSLLRTLTLLTFAPALIGTASASDLVVGGKAGYLGEWELSARLTPEAGGGQSGRRLSGSYKMVHTGVCTVGDPETKTGIMSVLDPGASRGLKGELVLDGKTCTFDFGPVSRANDVLSCSNGTRVPMTLQVLK